MRTLAMILGAAAVIAVAAPVSADPAAGRVQLAQAQDAQSGSGMGASQQGSSGNRNSGAAATRNSQGSGAAARESNGGRTMMRGETQGSSRTTVRARSGGDRVAVHGRSHTAVGVRSAASDDAVIIKRKKARRYVYSEPSTTIVKKRRYTRYHEPSSAVIVKKRRAGVAVDSGVSTRTSVRSRTSTAVGGSSTKRTGTAVRERSSGQGNAGAASSTEGRAPSGARSGGANTGRSAPSGGDKGQSPSGQQESTSSPALLGRGQPRRASRYAFQRNQIVPGFTTAQGAASPPSVHGPILPEGRFVRVIRRILRLGLAHRAGVRRALRLHLRFGLILFGQLERRGADRCRCANCFRLRRPHGSGRNRLALPRQWHSVGNDRPWRRLVGGETRIDHPVGC